MNRKNLTAAVLAGLAGAAGIVGSAQAVNINPDGLGQVLIYPYYTTNGGNMTVLSVVNTSEDAKAVKVRFLEGQNSQEVLDFNLYMSAFDVWAAAVFDDDGTPTLVVNDTSCTVPYLYLNTNDAGVRDGRQEFLPYRMAKDGGSSDISRAAEGHFEMIEMGMLVDDNGSQPGMKSATAATHGASGVPANCGQLIAAWTVADTLDPSKNGYWLNNAFTDLSAPTGGLFGGAAIVNVSGGAMYSYDAKAINGFADALISSSGPLHEEPGSNLPSLNSGGINKASIFGDDGVVLDMPIGVAPNNRPVDAVSWVFMHDQIMNEYTTEAAVAGHTEWVITFPTRAFYVYLGDSGVTSVIPPFTKTWPQIVSGFCETVVLDTIWDREEGVPGKTPGVPIPPIVSPAPPDPEIPGVVPFHLCYETSVIRFGDPDDDDVSIDPHSLVLDGTEILGSKNFHTIDNDALGFEYGWARLDMNEYPETDAAGNIVPGGNTLSREMNNLMGLPVTGFAVQRFANGFLGDGADVLANYGGIFQHKGTRLTSAQYHTPPAP